MKKKSEDSVNLSPKELARYVVVHSADDIEKYNVQTNKSDIIEFIKTKYTFYEKYIRRMNKEEYIEYLEQLLKEVEFYWAKRFDGASIIALEYHSICSESRAKSNKHELKHEISDRDILNWAKNHMYAIDHDFNSTKYIPHGIISDWTMKSFWDNYSDQKPNKSKAPNQDVISEVQNRATK